MKLVTEVSDFRKLVRAYGILAGTCDAERAIVGKVSRAWIAAEVEQMIPLTNIPENFFISTRGREVLADEFFSGEDIDADEIDPLALDIENRGQHIYINSNRLPKLEPVINATVVAANLLLGVQLYGKNGAGNAKVDNDLIIATMLQDTLGKKHRYSSIKPESYALVDEAFISQHFGRSVLDKTSALEAALKIFLSRSDQHLPDFSTEIANAVAAVMISRLRLTARAAGDMVLSFAGKVQCKELKAQGIDTDTEFAEKPFLETDFHNAQQALSLRGVDHGALREPIRSTLMTAVQDVLEEPHKRSRLSGRRGKAVHDVHMNMPVMEYYVAAEAPNALATLHLASLEMMRYLEKGRRKSYSTMLAHAFRLTAIAESTLGSSLEPGIATIALLHDVVEDGSSKVTGYDQSLQKIMFRFGGPIAAMVSEVTDSSTKQDALQKARKTFDHPELMMPDKQYNTGRLNKMALKATDTDSPYTLAGIVVKLIDTIVSFDEGIRDPDLMTGWWRHSGARVYWAERVRGAIIKPLLERLVVEIRRSSDNKLKRGMDIIARRQLRGGISLIAIVLDYGDLYAAQNLAILSFEYNLDKNQREKLIRNFFDPELPVEDYVNYVLQAWLTEERLEEQIRAGRVPTKSYVALYPPAENKTPQIDSSTFVEYTHSARRRIQIRRELSLYSPRKRNNLQNKIADVIRLYDYRMQTYGQQDS